jgi:hypothetical protein
MRKALSIIFLGVTIISFAQGEGNNPKDNLDLSDKWSLALAILSFIISVLTFFFARYQEWKSARGAVIKALQGEKEAVAYVAYKVKSRRWDKRIKDEDFRKDVIAALCLAWSLEGADRPKAIVFDTLREMQSQKFGGEIQEVLKNLHRQFTQYRDTFRPKDFDHRITNVENLMTALEKPIR